MNSAFALPPVPGDGSAPARRNAPEVRLAHERAEDRAAVDRLIDGAFGPGRFAKTAERLREGNSLRADLSVCAWLEADGGEPEIVGAVRLWPVRVGDAAAVFLGPIAVRPDQRRHGLGADLTLRACEAARTAGERAMLLVGAASFFAPLGFETPPRDRLLLPGPVDPRRLLWRALQPGGLDGLGGVVQTPARGRTPPEIGHRGPVPWLRAQ